MGKKIRVWVDGSHARHIGAYAVLAKCGQQEKLDGESFFCATAGINYVELTAVVSGLKVAQSFGLQHATVIVYTDSNYVTTGVWWLNEWWRNDWRKSNGWQTVSFAEQWGELRTLLLKTQARVTLRGRCSTPELVRVDEHAKQLRRLYEEQIKVFP